MNIEQEKKKIRDEIRRRRQQLDPSWVRAMSQRIMERVLSLDEFRRSRCVAGYWSQPKEVQTRAMIERCWESGQRLCVPAFDLEQSTYRMTLLEKGTEMVPGPAGILEPRVVSWIEPEEIDFMVVPAVAFDLEGTRLGHGGGHYDRILSRSQAYKVGTVFEFQVFERLPRDGHDQRVHLIITEVGEHRCMASGPTI